MIHCLLQRCRAKKENINGNKQDDLGVVNLYQRWDDSEVMNHDSWLIKRAYRYREGVWDKYDDLRIWNEGQMWDD